MVDERTEKLIEKLDKILSVDGLSPSVSPTLTPGEEQSSPHRFISGDMEVEKLSEGELYLVHAWLHRLYASKTRTLKEEEIKKLHREIRSRINHSDFDRLDREDDK